MSFPPFFLRETFQSAPQTFVRGLLSVAFVALLGLDATVQAQSPVPNAPNFLQNSGQASHVPQRAPQNAVHPPQKTQRVSQSAARSPQFAPQNRFEASTIWSNFLFGSGSANAQTPRRRSPMKFAFSPENAPKNQSSPQFSAARSAAPNVVAPTRPAPQASASAQNPQNRQFQRSRQISTPESLAESRSRRLQELNAYLAARRPDEFARRVALRDAKIAQNASTQTVPLAPNAQLEELRRVGANVAASERFAATVENAVPAPFDAARANRSKIRQASPNAKAEIAAGVAPAVGNASPNVALPLPVAATLPADFASAPIDNSENSVFNAEFADDALGFAFLPIRPNALQIAPQIFLSSEIVPLPSAAALEPESNPVPAPAPQTNAPTRPETLATLDANQQNATSPAPVSTQTAVRPLEKAAEAATRRVADDAFVAPCLSDDASPAASAPTLPAKPTFERPENLKKPVKSTVSDAQFPVHRPASPFVDSRTVPDKD